MERIASFRIDHNKLMRGIYLSRQDGDVLTFDLRLTLPNREPVLSTGTLHAIEHIGATYLRNSAYQDKIIYFGPMGCRTGCYLLTRDLGGQELVDLVIQCFRFIQDFNGEIPGAEPDQCGNYSDMDLAGAKEAAARYCIDIAGYTARRLSYEA